MKFGRKINTLFVMLGLVGISTQVIAMDDGATDKTLSPYFLVLSEDTGLDQLPLKSTSAKVNISGVIADVVVTQIYKNEGQKPLEAIYVFPASTRAALYVGTKAPQCIPNECCQHPALRRDTRGTQVYRIAGAHGQAL